MLDSLVYFRINSLKEFFHTAKVLSAYLNRDILEDFSKRYYADVRIIELFNNVYVSFYSDYCPNNPSRFITSSDLLKQIFNDPNN